MVLFKPVKPEKLLKVWLPGIKYCSVQNLR